MTFRTKALLAVLGLGLLACLFVVLGLAPIRASSGHWAVTESLLQFIKQRAVGTQSLGTQAPDLSSERLMLTGAGHYESGCRWCHGAPGAWLPTVMQAATPRPPSLQEIAFEYESAELFYIVKHGIKFTGMPAWPTQDRDDEVWAVVAFLRKLPELDAAGYARLVFGGVASTETVAAPALVRQRCARCHGVLGHGRGLGAFPVLAGQREAYLLHSLRAYAEGARPSGIMQPLAAQLSEQEMRTLAHWYAGQERVANAYQTPGVGLGRQLALKGMPERDVPACADCHGPQRHASNRHYPVLGGQPASYLLQQLELFARDVRGGSKYGQLMREVRVHKLHPHERQAVANFYAGR